MCASLAWLLLLFSLPGLQTADPERKPDIQISVVPERSSYLLGEPIFLEVVMTNRSSEALSKDCFNLMLTNWACFDLIFRSSSPRVGRVYRGCGYAGPLWVELKCVEKRAVQLLLFAGAEGRHEVCELRLEH
jgi:hypothetical protein